MKTKTKNLALTAILVAVMLLFGFTPVGFIPIGPVQVTLMCLPVMIGAMVLGIRTGFVLGVVFAVTSLAQLLMGTSVLFNLLVPSLTFGWYLVAILLIIFVPRLLIGPLAYMVYTGMGPGREKLRIGIASAVGSLTNTVLFLGMLHMFFGGQIGSLLLGGQVSAGITALGSGVWAFILSIGLLNGLPEAAAAVLVCIPVVGALKKSYKLEGTGEKF